ncbi:MAG: nuclear transport factor 2 family protein [Flavobacterium sp.]
MKAIIAILLLLAAGAAHAQEPETSQLYKDVVALDKAVFDAYNRCDTEAVKKYFSDDLEFYHDKGGVTLGAETLAEITKKNLCSRPGWKIRRELIPSSVKVYPMDNYGVIITGEHLFYVTENGKESLTGRALFTHLCRYRDGKWQITRVLSYSHGPAK